MLCALWPWMWLQLNLVCQLYNIQFPSCLLWRFTKWRRLLSWSKKNIRWRDLRVDGKFIPGQVNSGIRVTSPNLKTKYHLENTRSSDHSRNRTKKTNLFSKSSQHCSMFSHSFWEILDEVKIYPWKQPSPQWSEHWFRGGELLFVALLSYPWQVLIVAAVHKLWHFSILNHLEPLETYSERPERYNGLLWLRQTEG